MAYRLGEYLNAMCTLESASAHVAAQFSDTMTREQMIDHLCCRELLLKHRIQTHNEAVSFHNIGASPITQSDIDAAVAGLKVMR